MNDQRSIDNDGHWEKVEPIREEKFKKLEVGESLIGVYVGKHENENFVVYAGGDRAGRYAGFSKYLENGNTLKVLQFPRKGENVEKGNTAIRTPLKNNDTSGTKSKISLLETI